MMYYLMWCVLTKQHHDITISFLPVGHTKFFPDAGFGMLKRQFRQTKVGCLTDIAEVVRKSASINHCQLVGNQRGDALVPSYDWADYFAEHTIKSALKGIKKMYHLNFVQTPLEQYLSTVPVMPVRIRSNFSRTCHGGHNHQTYHL